MRRLLMPKPTERCPESTWDLSCGCCGGVNLNCELERGHLNEPYPLRHRTTMSDSHGNDYDVFWTRKE